VQDCKSWPSAIAEALPKRKLKKDEEAEEDQEDRLFGSSCGGDLSGDSDANGGYKQN